ncbi:hypothetical protein F511_15470 [Dorcoceras hygrometricum]|uniref:Uncharacterized protein n=1 Tax=Dorcoceras hygrometricum TaxID=472368 RepID=A0A2Z7BCG6_9LAMI|nr:hypothetical protein F511_15470 [Dorcoceras hygrometricum]
MRESRIQYLCDLNGSGIQLAVGPQPLWLQNHNSGPAQRIMVKRLATSPHDPLGITDSACKNQSVVVSVRYGPFNPYIPIRSTTIGKSRVTRDPIAMHTSWRSNSDIASVTSIGYPRMSASGESSTTMHRLLHASGSHPIPTPYDSRTEFSFTGDQLTTSCKKRELKIKYRLLSDILDKSVTVKAGSFDAVTHERFLMMTAIFGGVPVNCGRLLFKIIKDMVTPVTRQARGYAVHICILLKNVPNLDLGDSKDFPPLKILTVITIGRYISINDKISVEDVEDVGDASRVNKMLE